MNDIEKKCKQLVQTAFKLKATDIHIVPKKTNALIRYRINQMLYDVESVTKKQAEKMIGYFKFCSAMDIGERRKPQSGSMEFSITNDVIYLRISTIPTPYQESLAIRLLPQSNPFSIQELSLFPKSNLQLLSLLKRNNGLLLLTGPTGSGKTTTLYSMLLAANELSPRNILTIEDPIEQKNEEFIQVEINEKANISYSEGLKAILRHDPDIIMIGEIRDESTARLAIRAALTGHLVLATLHSSNSVGAIHRLLDFGVSFVEIEQTVKAVISQRLVNGVCFYCGERCSLQCQKISKARRYALYEILTNEALEVQIALAKGEKRNFVPYQTLEMQIKKAIALGYVPIYLYEWLVGDQYGS